MSKIAKELVELAPISCQEHEMLNKNNVDPVSTVITLGLAANKLMKKLFEVLVEIHSFIHLTTPHNFEQNLIKRARCFGILKVSLVH